MKGAFLMLICSLIARSATAEYLFSESPSYAGLASVLAEYFNSACIYLLTDSRTKDARFVERVIKIITRRHQRSANVYTFDEYHRLQEKDVKTLHCYVPLQVVISHDEETHQAFVEHSRRTSMHGSDSYGGGIWLVFLDSISPDYLNKYFSEVNTPFDVQLFVAELRHNYKMLLKEVYRVSEMKPLRTPFFGSWSLNSSLQSPPPGVLYSRRNDLEGELLKVGYVHSPPFTYHTENGERLNGYLVDIWEVIQSSINITSFFKKKNSFGAHLGNGSWTGLIDSVHREEFAIGLADFALTHERFAVIDYSLPLMLTSFQVIYKNLGSTIDADAMFLPLGYDMWATLAGWILLAAILLYLGCYLSDKTFNTRENMSFTSAMFFVTGALCGQAGFHVPKRFTCRTLFLSSFLITAIVIPSYSASLMSYLTILPPIVPFRNMKEFYEVGKFRMMVKYSSYEYDLFAYETTNDPHMHQIFKKDIEKLDKEEDFPASTTDAISQICENGGLAYFALNEAVEWAVTQIRRQEGLARECSIRKMPFDAGKVSIGVIFPKKSHFRGIINHYLHLFISRGIFKRLLRKHWPLYMGIKIDDLQPVGLNNVFMMFVVLSSGMVLSLLLFIAELTLGRRRQRKGPKSPMKQNGQIFLKPKFPLEFLGRSDKNGFFHAIRRREINGDVFFYNY